MTIQKWQEVDIFEEDFEMEPDGHFLEDEGGNQNQNQNKSQEQELKGFAKRFHSDVRSIVKTYIEQFFKDKVLHCGGKIPNYMLLSERRISMVLNYDIIRGVERAYNHLEELLTDEDKEIAKNSGEVTSDIKLVTEVLLLLSRSYIPQQFAGGMLLLYLEFVEGIDIGTYA